MMKPIHLVVTLALLAIAGACTPKAPDAPKATVSEPAAAAAALAPGDLAFSSDGSRITFVGAKITGSHEGSFKSFKGSIDSKAPSVVVDIDTKSLSTEPAKLEGHLKSADFFDVEKFPTAHFQSVSIKDGTVTGDLTLHGVTKRITFPAKITAGPDAADATAEFSINRKDFGLVYPGKPDDLIKDDVVIKLDIHAKKSP